MQRWKDHTNYKLMQNDRLPEEKYLVHKTLLSIMIGILHWVQLVHHGWLSSSTAASVQIVTSAGCTLDGRSGCSDIYVRSCWTCVGMIMTTESFANSSWLSLETIVLLTATTEDTALLPKLFHGDRW